jgi:hypothetical protein
VTEPRMAHQLFWTSQCAQECLDTNAAAFVTGPQWPLYSSQLQVHINGASLIAFWTFEHIARGLLLSLSCPVVGHHDLYVIVNTLAKDWPEVAYPHSCGAQSHAPLFKRCEIRNVVQFWDSAAGPAELRAGSLSATKWSLPRPWHRLLCACGAAPCSSVYECLAQVAAVF